MMTSAAQRFYCEGGTLSRDAPSYVSRRADDELYEELLSGEFCYVLTTRQMGKSSLMVRTAVRLRTDGCAVAIVDLSGIGNNLTVEQWYDGVMGQIGRGLKITAKLDAFWQERAHLSPLQRWMEALQDVVLKECPGRVVLFVDEIDAVPRQPFRVDEFFTAIRTCYNRRAEFPEYGRLIFCLMGVATPNELINDVQVTPFNIGRRIELTDFTPEEAAVLGSGLGSDEIVNESLLERVLYWTGGHPCLTQRLCQAIAYEEGDRSTEGVDPLCRRRFLAQGAERKDDNLVFVRDRLLQSNADRASLLDLYGRILDGRRIPDNEADPLVSLLKLAGIVRSEKGELAVRNRIYAHVFNRAWIRKHMPDAELRRQRAAYLRGVLRTVAVSAVMATFVGSLVAVNQAHHAQEERERADRFVYAADMNLAQQSYDRGDYGRVAQLLEEHRPKPGDSTDLRGFEWRYFWRLMHRDRHTFFYKGTGIVSSVALSPDGKTLAASNGDGTIKIWDLASWREVATLSGHTRDVTSVAFSPDGRWLASASLDRTVKLWDVAARREAATLKGHNSAVYSVAFSPGGRWLATGSDNGEVKLWDVASHHEVDSHVAHKGIVYPVAFSPDGLWLATGSWDGEVKLWTAPSLSAVASFPKGKRIFALAFSPDSKEMAVGRTDGNADILNVATRRRTAVLTGHKAEVSGIAFSPDGRYLATGSWDATIRLWNVGTGKPVGQPFIGHTNRVTSVAFSPDGRWLVSGGSNEVKVWDFSHREQNLHPMDACRCDMRTLISPDHSVTISPGNALQQFIFDRSNQTVMLWDIANRTTVICYPLSEHVSDHANSAALSPDGKNLAVGTGDGKVTLRNVAAGRQTRLLRVDGSNSGQTDENVAALAFSPDGRALAAASGDPALVTVWNVESGQEEARFKHTNSAQGIAFSPDGKILAAANWQGRVYLWNLATKTLVDRWWAHTKPVNDVAFSPDGKTLATAGDDATVKLWNVATHREMVTLTGPGVAISSIAFSSDGNRLAALSSADVFGHRRAWIWKASSLADSDAPSTRP